MAKDVIITPLDGDIQFQNTAGTNAGLIEQTGDDLAITNAVGDVLIGDGSSDLYIGDGVASVDLVFDVNGSVRGETGVTLTLGASGSTTAIAGLSSSSETSAVMRNTSTGALSYRTLGSNAFNSTSYLPLTGGTLTDSLTISSTGSAVMRITNTTASNSWIQYVGSNDDFIIRDETDSRTGLIIQGDGDVIMPSGNVGIGTTSPARTLHVSSGATNEVARFESTDTEVTLEFKDTTGTSKIKSRADFRFETGATPTEAMRIDSSGNVGIGDTTPTYKLDVNGSGHFVNDLILDEDLVVANNIYLTDTNTALTEGTSNTLRIQTGTGYVDIGSQNATFAHIVTDRSKFYLNKSLSVDGGIVQSYNEDLQLRRAESSTDKIVIKDNQFDFDLAGSTQAKIEPNGKLSLISSTTTRPSINSGSVGTEVLNINSGDLNVNSSHIYLNNPTDIDGDLYVAGEVGGGTLAIDAGGTFGGNLEISNGSPTIAFETGATHYNWQIGAQENVDAAFEISVGNQDANAGDDTFSPKLVVKQNGNVGIGTTSPNAQLQIDTPSANNAGQGLRLNRPSAGTNYHSVEFATNGTVDWSVGQNSNDAFEVYENGAAVTTRFTIKEGGNVGIGDTTPSDTLVLRRASSGQTEHGLRLEYVDDVGPTTTNSAVLVGDYGLKFKNYNSSRNFLFETGNVDIEGNIRHTGDTNTYFGFHNNDQWRVVTGGYERIEVSNSAVVINDGSRDYDFRVESNNNSNMLRVNGGRDAVGIGIDPSTGIGLHVYHATADAPMKVQSGDSFTGITFQDPSATNHLFYKGSENHFYFNGSGVTLGVGVNSITTTNLSLDVENKVRASGIMFGTDTADANTLDDYEEGTFTPIYRHTSGTPSSVTYDSQTYGVYTRIGNVVHCSGRIRTDAITWASSSYNTTLGGFPFTCATPLSTGTGAIAGTIGFASGFAGTKPVTFQMRDGETNALLYGESITSSEVRGQPNIQSGDFTTGTSADKNTIVFQITYHVA